MNLRLVTGPGVEPVSLEEAKLHLRVDHEADDALISMQIKAARQRVESFTGRALISQTWRALLDEFPAEALELPLPPLQSVTHVKYVDAAGDLVTWSPDEYSVQAHSSPWAERGRVVPRYGYSFPSPRYQDEAVEVEFVAGYGSSAAAVPESLRAALLLRLGDLYARRESGITGTIFVESKAEQLLMWPFRSMRVA